MSRVFTINRRLRSVRRYVEILRVLARYGFGGVVQELHLDRLVERGVTLVSAGRLAPEFHREPRQVRLRKAMEELGATFIKLGQVLSTRPDLIPEEWANEFRNLQDDCPQMSFEVVQDCLRAEFPGRMDELFEWIDQKALAAGSMAQVHRARLRGGIDIVIKVLRPGVREQTEADMEILHALAEFAEEHFSNLGYSPTEVVNEFARELQKEVDLSHEGRATERLRGCFADDPGVVFPRVYWDATTRNVLALEEIKGTPLSRLDLNSISLEDRKALVANGANAVLRQCLEIGFFHADPHPGNLFALPGGRVAFIDCGMTAQLDERTAQRLADLVTGVVRGDVEQVLGVVAALADVEPLKLEDRTVRADVRDFVSHFVNTPLERLNMGQLLREFFQKLREHKIRCPGDLVLLIKALTTIESVGARLDPQFDMVAFARPYVERLVRRKYGYTAMKRRLASSLNQYVELVEDLPAQMRLVLTQLRRNRFAVNLEHRGLTRLTQTIEHASRNIAYSMIIAAMLVGSSILVLADRGSPNWGLYSLGVVGFLGAFTMSVLVLLFNRQRRE